MKRTPLLWIVMSALIATAGCSKSDRQASGRESAPQGGAAVGTGGAGADVRSDSEFVHDVASKNMAEIELSRMALEKTTSRVVRAFAQMMIDDHGTALNKLKTAASNQATNWPTGVDEKYRETAESLATRQGAGFDRDYLKAMIEGHQDLAAKLETRLDVRSLQEWKTAAAGRTERNALPDPKSQMADVQVRPNKSDDAITSRISQWAAETYPIVQKHLDNARAIENALEKGSTESNGRE